MATEGSKMICQNAANEEWVLTSIPDQIRILPPFPMRIA